MGREIKSYTVRYSGNLKGENHTTRAVVYLYHGPNELIGILRFKMDQDDIPPRDVQDSSGRIHSYFPQECFSEIMNILRNERPVYIGYGEDESAYGYLYTGSEPVGEGEVSTP